MRCSEVRGLWPALLDGNAGETARASVDEHVRGCAACERERQSLLMAENLLQRYARLRRAPPAGLVDRVMRRLDAAAKPALVREVARLAAAAAVILGVSVFAIGRVSYQPVVEEVTTRAEQTKQYVLDELPQIIASVWRSRP